jgi:phage protein D
VADSSTTQLTPTFIVYLNGKRLSSDMESDIKEIVVEKRIDYTSSFAITMADMGRKWTDNANFVEGSKIRIMLGYKDAVQDVIEAVITGISPVFRKNSDERVIIRGSDIMHVLHRGKKTIAFSNMTDKQIVQKIAKDAGIGVDAGDIGATRAFTMQNDMTDYEFLMAMAVRYNCRMVIKKGKMIFKPLEDAFGDEVIAEWGKTLIEFHPHLDSTKLVTEVEVRGWDNIKGNAITGTAGCFSLTNIIGGGIAGGLMVGENFGDMKMIMIDEKIMDAKSAEKAALELLTGNSMSYINATAKVQGNNKINAGMTVKVKEAGRRFSGEYFVTEVSHLFVAEQGYTTRFKCHRNTAGI